MARIKELIKSYSAQVQRCLCISNLPIDEEGYLNINVVFDNDGREDETQFDIVPRNFYYGAGKCKELEELWRDFCKENKLKRNSVTKIYIPKI